jgi:hypothetical protein
MKPLDPSVVPSRPEFDVHLGTIAARPYHPRFDVNPSTGEPMGRTAAAWSQPCFTRAAARPGSSCPSFRLRTHSHQPEEESCRYWK